MKALEILKEKLFKLCASFDGVWISQEKLDETAKELEKTVKENSEDRLEELEKAILDYYIAKGYQVGEDDWDFKINISTFRYKKEIQIMFRQDICSNWETVFRIEKQSTKEMFDAAFEYFSTKQLR